MKSHAIYEEASAKGVLEAEIERLRGTLQAIMDRSEPDSWAYVYAKQALERS